MPDLSSLQHTLPHTPDCPACRAELLEINRKTEIRRLKFRDAAEIVLDDEAWFLREENAGLVHDSDSVHVGARTHSDHVDFVGRLNRFFADFPLEQINEGHWRAYQKYRLQTAGSVLINHETSFLSRVLDRAGLWKDLKSKCPRLQTTKSEAGRSMSDEEQHAIMFAASSRPRWKAFYYASLIMLGTTRPQGEILFLRIKDLDMTLRILSFREGRGRYKLQPDGTYRRAMKTAAREEDLPMTDTIYQVCALLLKRHKRICRRLGIEQSPEHYLFPGRKRGGKLDPTRPLKSFKKAWAGVCAAAGVTNLRIEDFRHHSSTKLQERHDIALGVIETIMGHTPNSNTKVDYRHIRHQAVLAAMKQIEVKPVRSVETVDNVVTLPKAQAVAAGKKSS